MMALVVLRNGLPRMMGGSYSSSPIRMKTNENGRKIPLPFSFSYFFDGNGNGIAGSENGSEINGNTKMGKYDWK
jgi:hypothetical protein